MKQMIYEFGQKELSMKTDRREFATKRWVSIMLFIFVATLTVSAQAAPPIKHLQRLHPWCYSPVDEHVCTRERTYQQEDYLAALTEKEIAAYVKLAEKGDADAMYLLSQVVTEKEDGNRDYTNRNKWLPRAADAGHPIAKYLLAEEAYNKRERIADFEKSVRTTSGKSANVRYFLALVAKYRSGGDNDQPLPEPPPDAQIWQALAKELTSKDAYTNKPLTDEYYLELIETAALAEASGDLAWRLAYSYANPDAERSDVYCPGGFGRNFRFLNGNPKKALHWARIAAGKGNIMAAETLCNWYYYGNAIRLDIDKRDPAEAAQWCTLAAQADCSSGGALWLSRLFREGVGVPKSAVDALYWERVYQQRK